mmetsp:Transcript_1681/g.3465  ORF Transcript_1681/g.3465 Transcript_1681/m.3465 type:complete len:244 (+) Transcript_1681:284-1015(+)
MEWPPSKRAVCVGGAISQPPQPPPLPLPRQQSAEILPDSQTNTETTAHGTQPSQRNSATPHPHGPTHRGSPPPMPAVSVAGVGEALPRHQQPLPPPLPVQISEDLQTSTETGARGMKRDRCSVDHTPRNSQTQTQASLLQPRAAPAGGESSHDRRGGRNGHLKGNGGIQVVWLNQFFLQLILPSFLQSFLYAAPKRVCSVVCSHSPFSSSLSSLPLPTLLVHSFLCSFRFRFWHCDESSVFVV